MKRGMLNFIIDCISFVDLLALIVTGLIIKYVLPPGTSGYGRGFRGGRGLGGEQIRQLWSMDRHSWGDIHFCFSLLFVFLMLVHILLHWNWIKSNIKSLLRRA